MFHESFADDVYFVYDEDASRAQASNHPVDLSEAYAAAALHDGSGHVTDDDLREGRVMPPEPDTLGFMAIPIAAFHDVESWEKETATQAVQAEIAEASCISLRHRDYRRFRHYDLIRSKLAANLEKARAAAAAAEVDDEATATEDAEMLDYLDFDEDPSGASSDASSASGVSDEPVQTRVRFCEDVAIREFTATSIVDEPGCVSLEPLAPILALPHHLQLPPPDMFVFSDNWYTHELHMLLRQVVDKFSKQIPSSFQEMNRVVEVARQQASVTSDNVLVAFEGVSAMGKQLIGVINRLQALAMRYLVLTELAHAMTAETAPLYIKQFRECLADCEELQRDIQLFKNLVRHSDNHMGLHSKQLSSSMRDSIHFSHEIKQLQSADGCLLHADNGPVNEEYMNLIKFLGDMKPDKLLRFLRNDFDRIEKDIADIDHLCGLVTGQARALLDAAETAPP